MIYLDDRAGSGDLLPAIKSRGVECQLTRMEYGDAAFFGSGADGAPVPVGVEIKQLSDVLKCITDGRFAGHQLPGLVSTYQYTWLLVEGIWRTRARDGLLETFTRRGWQPVALGSRTFMARDLDTWLLTMSIRGGIRVAHTSDRQYTAAFLCSLYHWWTNKLFDQHRSHLAPDTSHAPDAALLVRPRLSRLVAKELPGIGWEKSEAVSAAFPTVLELAVATEDDWQDIPGIGPKIARKVVSAIRTGK